MSPIRQICIVAMSPLLSLGLTGCAAHPNNIESAQSIDELEKENAELRQQLDTLRVRLDVLASDLCSGVSITKCDLALPQIDATVLDVQGDLQVVLLDRGARDLVELGYVFDVFRGRKYKGRVRITEVLESTSSGEILHETNPMEKGDSATTRL